MQAIGFIETRGLVAAIEGADAMLKAADVRLVERTFVKGGIVTITVTGDVATCKASVDAAVAAITRMNGTILSQHVIPRPHESLDGIIVGSVDNVLKKNYPEEYTDEAIQEASEDEAKEEPVAETEETPIPEKETDTDAQAATVSEGREWLEAQIKKEGLDQALAMLKNKKAGDVKQMVNDEYGDCDLEGRSAFDMTKKELIELLKEFYNN